MPSWSAIWLWFRPRSRLSLFRRAPRKSLRCTTISQVVNIFTKSTSHNLTYAHFSLQLFNGDDVLLHFVRSSRGKWMPDFSAVVAAPPGRFDGIERPYEVEDVLRLRGSVPIE